MKVRESPTSLWLLREGDFSITNGPDAVNSALDGGLPGDAWQIGRKALLECAAIALGWAEEAGRFVLRADECTQLHHCLVVVARGLRVEELISKWLDGFPCRLSVGEGVFQTVDSAEDTNDISVYDRDLLTKLNTTDR